jgi:hypothetical protein
MRNKRKILGIGALLLLVAAMLFAYVTFRESAQTGSKYVELSVTDDTGSVTCYTVGTDALYLQQVMEQAEGLTFEMEDGMVHTVNGVRADYVLDSAYWSFYVNDDYCSYGIAQQPVEDGDVFSIVYTNA